MTARIEIKRGADGDYRWSRIAVNGEPIAQSGEGYVDKDHAVKMARSLFPGLPIIEVEGEPMVPPEPPEPVPPPEDPDS